MNQPQEVARLLFQKIIDFQPENIAESLLFCMEGINALFLYATQEEKLKFSDFNSRISFAGHKFNIEKRYLYIVFDFRKKFLGWQDGKLKEESVLAEQGITAYTLTISEITKSEIPKELYEKIGNVNRFLSRRPKTVAFKKMARIVLLENQIEAEQFIAIDEADPAQQIQVKYNITARNDYFNPTIELIQKVFGLPLSVNLIDIEIDHENNYFPKAFVIHPDYLLDITSISECFQYYKTDPRFHLLKKFIPKSSSKSLIVGNIANYFLDELTADPTLTFKELIKTVFRLAPMSFCMMNDSEVREVADDAKRHFHHLKDSIQKELSAQNITPEDCYLEPSFYSSKYGIQGRLDLWKNDGHGNTAIVELKSGSPFMPNQDGLSSSHYIQTLMYDLLVKSVFDDQVNPTNYILYSKVEESRLRFARVSHAHQIEALQTRNRIIALEQQLTRMNADIRRPLNLISPEKCTEWKGFVTRDLERFDKGVSSLNPLEDKYFRTWTGFIAREHFMAKIGGEGPHGNRGQANLWLKPYSEKEAEFKILAYLKVDEIIQGEKETLISFFRTERTNPLANFRMGDVVVLYPNQGEDKSVLDQQMFKCSLVNINHEKVTVRLRAKQHKTTIFKNLPHWNLEHDLFDSSFNHQYKQLLLFSEAKKEKRDLLLGLRPPAAKIEKEVASPQGMTQEQEQIFKEAIEARELFLLWGPPGTGKTSVMLKNLVGYHFDHSKSNVLLLYQPSGGRNLRSHRILFERNKGQLS